MTDDDGEDVLIGGEGITATQVDVSWYMACALTADGIADCWADDTFYTGDEWAILTGVSLTSIAVGELGEGCGIQVDGTLLCWAGLDGNGDDLTDPPPGTFTKVSIGDEDACAIGTDGSLSCWGLREFTHDSP